MKIGKFPTLETLLDELERVDAELRRLAADAEDSVYIATYERHWALRGLINATPSRSLSDIRAKAAVLRMEAARDADFECDVSGSARELAKSLAADVVALEGCAE